MPSLRSFSYPALRLKDRSQKLIRCISCQKNMGSRPRLLDGMYVTSENLSILSTITNKITETEGDIVNCESGPGKLGSLSMSSYSTYAMGAIHYVPLGPLRFPGARNWAASSAP